VRRRILAVAGFVVGGIVAGTAYERRLAKRRDRLDVYFDDGSFVTYVEGSTEADQLLPLARQVLAAVHETRAA
jgi:outer membrane lipoprotein SlyB